MGAEHASLGALWLCFPAVAVPMAVPACGRSLVLTGRVVEGVDRVAGGPHACGSCRWVGSTVLDVLDVLHRPWLVVPCYMCCAAQTMLGVSTGAATAALCTVDALL
jgi:hypothetical protein